MSPVTCHLSHVICHMSHVTCHLSPTTTSNIHEWVYFAYWWKCIGKGLRLQPAQQAFLIVILKNQIISKPQKETERKKMLSFMIFDTLIDLKKGF